MTRPPLRPFPKSHSTLYVDISPSPPARYGGAVYVPGRAALIDCSLSSNSARDGGAVLAIVNNHALPEFALPAVTVTGSVLSKNYAAVRRSRSTNGRRVSRSRSRSRSRRAPLARATRTAADPTAVRARLARVRRETKPATTTTTANEHARREAIIDRSGAPRASRVSWFSSQVSGGAVTVMNSSFAWIEGSRFEANQAGISGGAIVVLYGGACRLADSAFHANRANGTSRTGWFCHAWPVGR